MTHRITLAALLLAAPIFAASLLSQEPLETVSGKVLIGSHKAPLTAGELYLLTVEGKGFAPTLTVALGEARAVPLTADAKLARQEWALIPVVTKPHRLFIVPPTSPDLPEGPLDFTLTLRKLELAKDPYIRVDGVLDAKDPLYAERSPHKSYPVPMKKGRLYVIDMVAKDKALDPLLYLEEMDGKTRKIAAVDDDSGGDFNARVVHMAKNDGEHTIIATCIGKGRGAYLLTVREQK